MQRRSFRTRFGPGRLARRAARIARRRAQGSTPRPPVVIGPRLGSPGLGPDFAGLAGLAALVSGRRARGRR